MAGQVQKPTLAGKFGARAKQAAAAAAKAPVRLRGQRLPPGIQGGIAKLTECYLGTYDKDTNQKQVNGTSAAGQLYLRMVGIVVEPKEVHHNGQTIPTQGSLTSIVIPICDQGANYKGSPLTFDDLVKEASNEMRLIAGEGFDTSDMDAAIKALADAKPHFRFTTTESAGGGINPKTKKPYEPRTWENWLGSKGLENWTPPDAAAEATQDDSGADAPAEAEESNEPIDETQGDINAIAEAADGGDEEATNRMIEIFTEAGVTDEQTSQHGTWTEALVLLQDAGSGDDGGDDAEVEEEEEPEPKKWKKGEKAKYKPPVKGPGGKLTPGKKVVTCTVATVYKNATADLTGPDGKTKYAKVPFVELAE